MAEPQISCRDIAKRYHKGGEVIEVLRGASCAVAAGEMVSVIGTSGAGKSTFLHVLGSLDQPDAGRVWCMGQPLDRLSPAAVAEFRNRHMGFVFQFHHLLGEFTALENVMMPALIRRLPERRARSLAEAALSLVGLSPRLHHAPGELSGGEQQRVALARALVLEPPLLFADEVTGNLDERTGEEIHALLFAINKERGTSQIIVTHNRALADRMPRRLELVGGKIEVRR